MFIKSRLPILVCFSPEFFKRITEEIFLLPALFSGRKPGRKKGLTLEFFFFRIVNTFCSCRKEDILEKRSRL